VRWSSSIKHWLSISDEEQERRFQARIDDPAKQWKLSPIDLEARARWGRLRRGQGRDVRLHGHEGLALVVVEADDKRTARLNLISHLLEQIPYESAPTEKVELPPRQERALRAAAGRHADLRADPLSGRVDLWV
jgi:hypothetical protein